MTHTITREFLRLHGACYDDAKIATLIPPDGLPLVDVLNLDIPAADRIWVATLPGACLPSIMWEWQARLVERALARVEKPDPRSLAVVPLLRRLAIGEAIPQSERDAANASAWDSAWATASAAASAAASASARGSARASASAASWARIASASAADRDAEDNQQIADLIDLLTKVTP